MSEILDCRFLIYDLGGDPSTLRFTRVASDFATLLPIAIGTG